MCASCNGLKSFGFMPVEKFAPELATIVQQNASTVREVLRKFQRGGIALVTSTNSNHPASDLEQHRTSLIEEFTQRLPEPRRNRIQKRTRHPM
jgi:transposase